MAAGRVSNFVQKKKNRFFFKINSKGQKRCSIQVEQDLQKAIIIIYNKIGNSSSKQSVNPNIILTQNEVRSVSLTDIETEKYLSLKMEPPILKVNTFAKSTSTAFKNNVKLTSSQQVPKMAVCVKPFHFEFNKALGLVEFIEMYRLQGAVHFMFYNHTLGQDVTKATIICLMFLPSKNTARDDFLFEICMGCSDGSGCPKTWV